MLGLCCHTTLRHRQRPASRRPRVRWLACRARRLSASTGHQPCAKLQAPALQFELFDQAFALPSNSNLSATMLEAINAVIIELLDSGALLSPRCAGCSRCAPAAPLRPLCTLPCPPALLPLAACVRPPVSHARS